MMSEGYSALFTLNDDQRLVFHIYFVVLNLKGKEEKKLWLGYKCFICTEILEKQN